MENKNSNEDDLPKLKIEQENDFKKLKLSIEQDASFFGKSNPDLPPEIEGQFLNYVSNFENAFKNAKKITVYEKIGKPCFKTAEMLSDFELTTELETVLELMRNNNMGLDVICDYENEDRLIYKFITEELFMHEIEDVNVPVMTSNFTYEEFHQNHKYDLEQATEDFLKIFFNKKSKLYKNYHSQDAINHEALNNFRFLFKKFKLKLFKIQVINYNETEARVDFNIDFWSKIKGTDTKILYSGSGHMTFIYQYGYWYVQMVELPINN